MQRVRRLAATAAREDAQRALGQSEQPVAPSRVRASARREQVESAQHFVEAARKRAEAGYASDFERIKSQADLIAANKAHGDAETRMSIARLTLNSLMGRNPNAPLTIAGQLTNLQPRGMRTDFLALAMARNPGWGKDFPEMLRNEDWNYAVFTTGKQQRAGVNQAECLACHKPLDKVSYTFTLKQLAEAK